jgi:hypothetical protein
MLDRRKLIEAADDANERCESSSGQENWGRKMAEGGENCTRME